jgi:hypothetical protein
MNPHPKTRRRLCRKILKFVETVLQISEPPSAGRPRAFTADATMLQLNPQPEKEKEMKQNFGPASPRGCSRLRASDRTAYTAAAAASGASVSAPPRVAGASPSAEVTDRSIYRVLR